MATLYVTFGPTHSGKTTFGKRFLDKVLPHTKTIMIDNDSVEAYLHENFNNLRTDPDVLRTRTPTNPDLRLRIPQLIADYALVEGYNVIITASHSKKVIRMKYHKMARRHNAKVVLLIFGTSAEEIQKRLQNSKKKDLSLNARSFKDLFEKRHVVLEQPLPEERALYDRVYEVDEHNATATLDTLTKEAYRLKLPEYVS
jgi:predicted kinase